MKACASLDGRDDTPDWNAHGSSLISMVSDALPLCVFQNLKVHKNWLDIAVKHSLTRQNPCYGFKPTSLIDGETMSKFVRICWGTQG